jgi:SAM-dependent methyltransferase
VDAPYSADFFRTQAPRARRSADAVVPLLMELIGPACVVDVGCATGAWLAAFRAHGVAEVLGIDGPWVDAAQLQIPRSRVVCYDLERGVPLRRTFDLAVSVEVAEHLDGRHADAFVASLTDLAPVVLFSAAIPGQQGVGHVHLRWPDYWVDRFGARGYVVIDAVRPRIWQDERVDWVYRQNCLVFVRRDRLAAYPALAQERRESDLSRLAVVHPAHYRLLLDTHVSRWSPRRLLGSLPDAVWGALRYRFLGWAAARRRRR